jgi:hypothetical protein
VPAKRRSFAARLLRCAVLGAIVAGTSACGGSSSPSSPSPPNQPVAPTLYVSVTGNFLIAAVGGSTQLRANANTRSGAQDVTSLAIWHSSNDSVATVSPGGLVSAKGTGLVVITATHQGLTGAGGISVATAVNLTGTWTGSSVDPTSNITLELVHVGDSVSGSSTVAAVDGSTYRGAVSGAVNGGTVVMAGSASSSTGSPFSSWTDERCALENANTLQCVNPSTLASGTFTLMQITFIRR